MKKPLLLTPSLALAAALGLTSCVTSPAPSLDAKTSAVLQAMNDRLAAAKTLRVQAVRTASPGFDMGMPVAQSARGTVVVRRPHQLAAHMSTNLGARDFGYNGRALTVVDRTAHTHAIVNAVGDIDAALQRFEEIYGVSPPVGVLLANHPRRVLLRGVTGGRHVDVQYAAGVSCDHMAFTQEGLSWELWVGTADHLPRRLMIAYANPGGAPMTMDALITQWELDPPLSDVDLVVAPPAGSREVEMIPMNH